MNNLHQKISYPPETVKRLRPVYLDSKDEILFSKELTKKLPAMKSFQVKNTFILPSGYVLDGLRLHSSQFMAPKPGLRTLTSSSLKSILSLFNARRIVSLDRAFFVTNDTSKKNLFHWCLDVLQKVEFIDGFITHAQKQDYQIILPVGHNSSFIWDSLPAFNFSVLEQSKHDILFVKELVLVPNIAPTGNYRKEVILKLSRRLRDHFSINRQELTSNVKVYITRQNALKRRILNEDKIIPVLQRYGFEILDMDRMSFVDQVHWIQNARMLVSLHGAGLTHMLWMDRPGKVLEIRARGDVQNNCYFTLASDLGLDYFYAFADQTDSRKTVQESDFVIDKEHFEICMAKLHK